MNDDVERMSLEELEVSVRTAALLRELPVSTVGELLSLEEIELPEDWPTTMARSVASELSEVFAELGVEYAGTLRVPEAAPAERVAEGTVAERWATIEEWLKQEHPEALQGFNPPASPESIAAAERALGVELPSEYKEFLAIHDGQDELAPFVGVGALLPIAAVVDRHQSLSKRADEEEFEVSSDLVGAGVRPVNYCRRWLPIGASARGRDFLCLDLDPAPGGTRGQIIEYVVDDGGRPLIANGFADLLSKYFEAAQSGEIDFDEF